MDKKTVFKQLGKMCIAGILAFLLLCLLTVLYYFPVTRISQPNGATEYTRIPHRFHTHFKEGHGIGVTDGNGYSNVEKQRTKAIPDILLMGASHMEAENVLENQSTVYKLNEIFRENDSDLFVYNIGMAAQYFCVCAKNLEYALDTFQPSKYVVIETAEITMDQAQMTGVLDNSMGLSRGIHDSGILYQLQKMPYLKLIYQQWQSVLARKADEMDYYNNWTEPDGLYIESINRLIRKMDGIAREHGTKLIIFYHPHLSLQPDGSAATDTNQAYLSVFSDACQNNGVTFINMADPFLDAYNESYILPHGFSNTQIGTGHLNGNGHRIIAEVLADYILTEEGMQR